MSPEQAKGLPADHRSDVFSFGCVLFEMLTGRQAFKGDTAAEILASVLVREPDLSQVPAHLDPRIVDVLRRCIDKNPRKRWHAVADARAELEAIVAAPRTATTGQAAGARRSWWRRAAPAAAAAVMASALTAGGAYLLVMAAPRATVTRFRMSLADGQFVSPGISLAVSPDGTQIAYVANRALYIRSLSELDARLLLGPELNLSVPTFSPDGSSVAFRAATDNTLKRIAITGGAPVTITSASEANGISWSAGEILFGTAQGIMRVPQSGGTPELIVPMAGEARAVLPQMLPDGENILFTMVRLGTVSDAERKIVVHSLTTGRQTVVVDGGSNGRYLPTGHIVYALGGVLIAVPFDPGRPEVTGGPVPVIEGLRRSGAPALFGVSSTGVLTYVPGPVGVSGGQQLVVADRAGDMEPLDLPAGTYDAPRVSPDGRLLAFMTGVDNDAAVWVYDLKGGAAMRRLTFEGQNRYPVWSADGRRVTFRSIRGSESGIFWQLADGTAAAERLTTADAGTTHIPEAWSPDGKVLLYSVYKGNALTLSMLSVGDRSTAPFGGVRSSSPINATFSPDGRWVAYGSTELGTIQVFVQPFPATGVKYQITRAPNDGHHPVWSPAGDELFLIPAVARFGSVKIATRPTLSFGDVVATNQLFAGGGTSPNNVRGWDITPGGRFVGLAVAGSVGGGSAAGANIHVVLNWHEELKRLVPTR